MNRIFGAIFSLLSAFIAVSSYAQFYTGSNIEFGQNRVQYHDFFWQSFHFEKFELRPDERKLFNDGKDIALGSRAFDMLCFLVENRQRFLSKAEILDAIWPDIAVEESNLTVQISALRKALGAGAEAMLTETDSCGAAGGSVPRAAQLVVTGACRISDTRRSSSYAPA